LAIDLPGFKFLPMTVLARTNRVTAAGPYTARPCPAGFDCSGSASQLPCPAGYYCPANSTSPTACTTAGYYCSAGSTSATQHACTTPTPNSLQYVTAACTSLSDTAIATATGCTTGQYLSGFSQGTYNSPGSAGTCISCPIPTPGTTEYVSTACTTTTPSVITTQSACTTAGQYISGLVQGNAYAAGNAGTSCVACPLPTPGTRQYVSTACTDTTPSVITTACTTGQYSSGLVQGSAYSAGNAGTSCVSCPLPVNARDYVSAACTATTPSVVTTQAACAAGQYISGLVQGSAYSAGNAGTSCVACPLPTPGTRQYVLTACTDTTPSVITTQPACTIAGQYISGFSQGSAYSAGNAGTSCVACPLPTPGTREYVLTACTDTTPSVITTQPACATGQYSTGLVQGSAYAAGTVDACSTCPLPTPGTTEYVSTVCTTTTPSVVTTRQNCPSGQFANGFSQGSAYKAGQTGTCTNCVLNPGGGAGYYVSDLTCTTLTNYSVVQKTICPAGQYLDGYVRGDTSTIGSAGTCTACTTPGYYCLRGSTSPRQYACSLPSSGQYVRAVCTSSTNTLFNSATVCQAGNYLSGFDPGDAYTHGSTGTCTACTTPGYFCPYSSTQITTSPTQYPCSNPTGSQYVTALCTMSSDTRMASVTPCPAGQYPSFAGWGYSSGGYNVFGSSPFEPGDYQTLGHPGGTCTACTTSIPTTVITDSTTGLTGPAYVSGLCRDGLFDMKFGIGRNTRNCVQGTYATGYSQGSTTVLGSPGTCTACTTGSLCPTCFQGVGTSNTWNGSACVTYSKYICPDVTVPVTCSGGTNGTYNRPVNLNTTRNRCEASFLYSYCQSSTATLGACGVGSVTGRQYSVDTTNKVCYLP
jgi:ribosome modulation factor